MFVSDLYGIINKDLSTINFYISTIGITIFSVLYHYGFSCFFKFMNKEEKITELEVKREESYKVPIVENEDALDFKFCK